MDGLRALGFFGCFNLIVVFFFKYKKSIIITLDSMFYVVLRLWVFWVIGVFFLVSKMCHQPIGIKFYSFYIDSIFYAFMADPSVLSFPSS